MCCITLYTLSLHDAFRSALKRMARELTLDASMKASALNDELKKAGRYNQPQWRMLQSWLDIGNAAAHGKFDQFTQPDVKRLIRSEEHTSELQSLRHLVSR